MNHKSGRIWNPNMRTRLYLAAILCLLFCLPIAAQTATPQIPPTTTAPPPTTVNVTSGPAVQVETPAQPGGEISGKVLTGTTPLPGVTISASNTLTGKKYFTST